jgi:hypothetical protein
MALTFIGQSSSKIESKFRKNSSEVQPELQVPSRGLSPVPTKGQPSAAWQWKVQGFARNGS